MKPARRALTALTLAVLALSFTAHRSRAANPALDRSQANAWYAKQPWLVGANYVPSNAINQLEMFQAETFDPAHQRPRARLGRIHRHEHHARLPAGPALEAGPRRLQKAPRHLPRHRREAPHPSDLRPLRLLLGAQPATRPAASAHPRRPQLRLGAEPRRRAPARPRRRARTPRLRHRRHRRLRQRPARPRLGPLERARQHQRPSLPRRRRRQGRAASTSFCRSVFEWARSVHPTQPLTSGVWHGNWSDPAKENATTKIQLAESDIITFHNYDWPEDFEARIKELQPHHRPILCTEYMARSAGSHLRHRAPHRRSAITSPPSTGASSTARPRPIFHGTPGSAPTSSSQPTIWFHDVFHPDGTPYRQAEVDLIRRLTSSSADPSH